MLLTSMSEIIQANKQNDKVEDSQGKAENNKPLLPNINIPSYLIKIQPRAMQLCNCDKIGFDPSGNWNRVICAYKFFQANECGRCKQESKHHSGAHYLSLPNPMGNA